MLKDTKNKATAIASVEHKKRPNHTLGSSTLALQKAVGNQAIQSIIQRSIMMGEEKKPYSALEIWNLLVQERNLPASARSSVMEELLEWDQQDESFESLEEIEDELGGYETEVQGESVFFEFDEDEEHVQFADDLMMTIKLEFGISLDSTQGFSAISNSLKINKQEIGNSQYNKGMKSLAQRTTESWTLEDLKALLEALKYFSPILGRNRVKSPRADYLQEITSFGKIDQAVDYPNTLAETFVESGHIVMYGEGTNEEGDYPEYEDKVNTFIHELTHGFLEHRLSDFKANVPYWRWVDKQEQLEDSNQEYNRPEYKGEMPPTGVAEQAVYEDFAESVMLFFTQRKEFKKSSPERFLIVSKIIKEEFGLK